jgi:undecaprenyl-diphosphatase
MEATFSKKLSYRAFRDSCSLVLLRLWWFLNFEHPLALRIPNTEIPAPQLSGRGLYRKDFMSIYVIATILGMVLGLTEYLPISSAGHLIVVGNLLNFTGPKATCFEVFLQIGAISAVLVLYRERFLHLIPWRQYSDDQAFSGWRGLSYLALTTLPAVMVGAAFHHYIKTYLFGPFTVAGALAVGGVAILIAEKYKPQPKVHDINELTYTQAGVVGLVQCLALFPGVSRSASTIIAGLFCGFTRPIAAEYSFLAAVPILTAAATYDLYKNWHLFHMSDIPYFVVGLTVSFLAASVAIRTFLAFLRRFTLVPFAYYRLAIAPIIYFAVISVLGK